MERLQIGRMQNPVRGFLHGSAALVSIFGLAALLSVGPSGSLSLAVAIYGLSLILLYTTSSLYHSVPWPQVWKGRLQRLDHTMIYVLVAGTFTPFLVAAVDGGWRVVGLAGIWGLAAIGLAREIFVNRGGRPFLIAQLVVGSACLVPLLLIISSLDAASSLLVVVGGVIYLVGVTMFFNNWPRLVPGIFSHHEMFHVFVVVASIAHFVAVWRVVSGA
jgi:hemolysin III